MKVLNLRCSPGQHAFEGWFGSEDDFQSQLARGLVECPFCTSTHVLKMPSAPRLNLSGVMLPDHRGSDASASGAATSPALPGPARRLSGSTPDPAELATAGNLSPLNALANLSAGQQAAFLKALREVVVRTEDVGQRFAEEARRMHYGEAEVRGIRGQASAREAVELLEEGIDVLPLPDLPLLKETLQ